MNSKILFLAVFLALAFIVKAQYDEDGTSTSTDASYYDYDYVKKRSNVNKRSDYEDGASTSTDASVGKKRSIDIIRRAIMKRNCTK